MKKISPGSFQDELDGTTGVIFFKDYWQRGKESYENRSGDHIGLWNKDRITSFLTADQRRFGVFGRVIDLMSPKKFGFGRSNEERSHL